MGHCSHSSCGETLDSHVSTEQAIDATLHLYTNYDRILETVAPCSEHNLMTLIAYHLEVYAGGIILRLSA